MVQQLGLRVIVAKTLGSMPGQVTKIPQATQQGWKEKSGAGSARQLLPQATCPSVPAPWNPELYLLGPSASLPFQLSFQSCELSETLQLNFSSV